MRVAGIDIGTLTCRLLIGEVEASGPVKTLHSDRKILRLGEGVDQSKQLSQDAITRVIGALQEWKQEIDAHDVRASTAVATSAVREAHNRDEFLSRVRAEAGLEVEVIDGPEEARRTLLGIRSGLPAETQDFLGLDIGGGSTEFIVNKKGQHPNVISIDIGVVRLTERVLTGDPPAEDELNRAEQLTRELTRKAFRDLGGVDGLPLIGTAGTITSLAAMAQQLTTYDPHRIHNYSLGMATVQEVERTVTNRTRKERVGLAGLEAGRAEVIVAGTLILRCIMEELGAERCLVSEYGLREGVLIDLAQRGG
ncbi:MAG: Ppx/GppA phosphatase family protein [Nitrospirota bacterium]|nr:Ppx/GppA phosphatase family protein [Nitrospirota bacterium]